MVQFFPFLCCDLSVFAFSDPVQSQIHDPDPFQLLYLISQIPAHSADLPVQSLCQNDLKFIFSKLFYLAWSCDSIQDRDTACHLLEKFICHGLINCNFIFFFMFICRTHHPVDNVAVVRHQKQPFRILIEPAHRINPHRAVHHVHNVGSTVLVRGGADDSARLMHR